MCIFGVYATFGVFGVPLYLMYVLDRLCLKVFLSNMCVPTTSLRDAKSLYFRGGNGGPPPHRRRGLGEADTGLKPTLNLAQILFYFLVAILSYSTFQWAEGKIREYLERLPLDCQQQELNSPLTSNGHFGGLTERFIAQKIYSFNCGCLCPYIFVSALRLLMPRSLTQAVRARTCTQSNLENSVRRAFWPCSSSRIAHHPNVEFGGTFVFYPSVRRLVCASRPLAEGFFICPKGTDIALVCTEKQMKIWVCLFWFGNISMY